MRVAVVGAGPAGCHLAHCLASGMGGAAYEILLFDPQAPYEKPCGGGLTPLVSQRFSEVMALAFPRYHPRQVVSLASDGSRTGYRLDPSDWAVVSRQALGRALLDRAVAKGNVRFLPQRVTDVERAGDGWQLRTHSGDVFKADFLVGADGVRSLVRRRVVGPIPRQHLGLAVGYRILGAPDALMFQTQADLEGYLWSFPGPQRGSAGIGSRLGAVPTRDLWQRLDRFLDEVCPGVDKVDRYAGLLPMARDASLWEVPCAGTGWALLGDAAGHVHPLTGEGIAYALWSAELLAEAFGAGDPIAFDSMWREHYGYALIASGEMLGRAGGAKGVYEVLFQLALAMALPA